MSATTELIRKDLVIVGGGPAGLTASIYARRSLLDAVTIEREATGGQLMLTGTIDNYPGLPGTDGYSLSEAIRAQAEGLGAEISYGTVTSVERDGATGRFLVKLEDRAYDASCVILAAGARPRRAGFEGEERFVGRGVSYCATCDGMFYRGKQVFVVGGGNSAAEEALFLSHLASKVVLVVRKDHLRAQAALVDELERADNVEIRLSTKVAAVRGNELPSEIELIDTVTGAVTLERHEEGSFGVFVLVGRDPESDLVRGLARFDEGGYVETNERMATETSGLYVAGDVRQKPLRQIVTAAADGAVAASSVAAYLGHPLEG